VNITLNNLGNKKTSVVLRRLLIASVASLALGSAPAYAGEGHDHGDAAPQGSSNGPKRLPDGSVFLPKPAQRQIGVLTMPVVAGDLQRAIELSGKVMMDPNAGGRVQSTQAGRIEPGPKGLPSAGQSVRKGEVLAYVVPSVGNVERSNQSAQLAELRAAKMLAEKRLARMKELADTIPRKEIDAVESEIYSINGRMSALGVGLSSREALIAPAAGVITNATVVLGQVVDAREIVFEIIDPSRLRIEALAYDPEIASKIASATLALGADRVPLRLVGSARTLREQALPITFQIEGAAAGKLAVGQPVRVFVQSTTKVKGFSVPAISLLKNPANQTIVWVKTEAERFVPRVVTVEPLDGVSVAITSGLEAGDRVATQAATLINQIR
jgi:membrane fusion protein, heavy metal efflux system